MRVVNAMLALAVSLALVGSLWAGEGPKPPKGKHHGHPRMEQRDVFQTEAIKGLSLTDDQKSKFENLKKEYEPKLKEAWQKMGEQGKAIHEAFKAVQAAGQKVVQAQKDAQAAVKNVQEQKGKMDAARKSIDALRKDIGDKVSSLLTTEQKEQLKKLAEAKRPHGPAKRECDMLKGVNLTDAQKAEVEKVKKEYQSKIEAAEKAVKSLHKEVRDKVLACLTPEQKAQLQQKKDQKKEQKKDANRDVKKDVTKKDAKKHAKKELAKNLKKDVKKDTKKDNKKDVKKDTKKDVT